VAATSRKLASEDKRVGGGLGQRNDLYRDRGGVNQ
jgi:hypothetical protein